MLYTVGFSRYPELPQEMSHKQSIECKMTRDAPSILPFRVLCHQDIFDCVGLERARKGEVLKVISAFWFESQKLLCRLFPLGPPGTSF